MTAPPEPRGPSAPTPRRKRSVSFGIPHPSGDGRVLTVLRPPDDAELPNLWGLPAGSLRAGETWEDAVVRSGREKLGVALEPGRVLNSGAQERPTCALEMRLLEARILAGKPAVPQPHPEVTQYADWRWAEVATLGEGAARGSLCCRLMVERAARRGGGGQSSTVRE